ncbi:uncharacterized protein Z519_12807 [Cladophialophora bantiana CBS 173.52]|uniref:Carboxylesterase type B domain-containing protein n=1 Tax=Cladophialophora bantiana (strain ATCC 10958 / CBS 173.52 / CDC B-1940 / NIH 8579) TaxID=1442370 RepID=A0A0D2E904_CLAB1|nr:uncharacterized protein Z519_12807 [Cladophialophora bantiana CBS 173.52]KIW86586.1 hypothetical protein Z519_12807 [Cladophialophora bantiana CBS 173.52]
MGFPNAAGLPAFAAIRLLRHCGVQSAGSRSTGDDNFAYYEDPIACGFFMQSGRALSNTANADVQGTNFTFVALNLGCDYQTTRLLSWNRDIKLVKLQWCRQPFTTANEYGSLAPYPVHNLTPDPNPQAALVGTLNTVRGIFNSCLYRNNLNIPTFRNVYGENRSNINPLWWMGAYHVSDLAMMIGIYGIRAGQPSQLETETSAAMQDYVHTFVKKDATKG